ncbi:hypothetical protein [Methylobacterium aquaticum]|uniref:PH domain-containing protein n=1 Tax=Methylobacterium aquaticum TaxID=270351 RepID=A0A0J6SQL8_9HYPH|nr:hypothetical protein [Methylobacterium aquaticum]KMO35663.1 hypothetical protein VP06_11855 [Methylobacterium aquaticum]
MAWLAAGFAAACAWMLLCESGERPLAAPGSLKQFFVACGLVLFGLGIPVLLRESVRRGPVVSVSPEGVFDRRRSTDWIPWHAIAVVDEIAIGTQGFIQLQVRPGLADHLPWSRRGRWHARLNGMDGGGYWIAGQGVRGGTRAVLDAIAQVRAASRGARTLNPDS